MTHLTSIVNQEHKRLITDLHLETLLDTLDRLHTAAHQGQLSEETTISQHELMGWLEDIIYTAQETLAEMEANQIQTEQSQVAKLVNIANVSVIRLHR
jgi:hypothetical protein